MNHLRLTIIEWHLLLDSGNLVSILRSKLLNLQDYKIKLLVEQINVLHFELMVVESLVIDPFVTKNIKNIFYLLRRVNNLSFNWIILNSFLHPINWDIFCDLILENLRNVFNSFLYSINCLIFSDSILKHLRNVFSLVLYCIVVSVLDFSGYFYYLSNFFVLHVWSFIWYIS